MILRDMTLASCATSREGARLVGNEGYENLIANIPGEARFNAETLKSFLEEYPPIMLARDFQVLDQDYQPIRNGLAMRVGLQYSDAKLKEVRPNGHLLKESPTDGYLVHHNQGTMVQVNIPPDKIHNLHVVKNYCHYSLSFTAAPGCRALQSRIGLVKSKEYRLDNLN